MPDLASITISSGSIALRAQQRDQRKLRAGRVAAGIGDEMRAGDVVAIDLGEAVDRLPLQLRRVVLVAVPARVGVGREPEVGRQIDHLDRRQRAEQLP